MKRRTWKTDLAEKTAERQYLHKSVCPGIFHIHELRGCYATRAFHSMKARFACGSGAFLSFAQKCCTPCNIFVQKHGIFGLAGGEIAV